MRYLGALIAACILASITSADTTARAATPPRVILWFAEYSYWSGVPMGYPLPFALRLLVYDDGTVITRSRARPEPQDPGFRISRISAADAADLVETIRTQLTGAAHRSGRAGPDSGTTALQFWDAEAGKREHYEADGVPCRASDAERQAPSRLRRTVDSRFLKVCDDLLRFQPTAAGPWLPSKLLVVLKRTDKQPQRTIEWPADWRRHLDVHGDPPDQRLVACVPIEEPLPPLASELLGLSGNWLTLQHAGVEGPDTAGWVIHKWWPALPGPLTTVWRGEEGVDYPGDCMGGGFGFIQ
jgi:hypothetical protein